MKRRALLLALVLPCATVLAGSPEPFDWPQWQGPDRNAVSKESGLLKEWPKGGPPLAWKIKGLGGGYSEPSIAAGRIYGTSNRGDDEVVWALSEKDGNKLWTTPVGPAVEQFVPQGKEGPGCTPTVDGGRLYVVGMGGDVACLETADGKIVWRRSMTKDFGGHAPMWSYRESPLVDGNKVICTPGGPDAMLVALDKATGKTIWKSKVPSGGASAGASRGRGPGSGNSGGRSGSGGGRGGFGGFGGGGGGAAYASAIAVDFDGQREYIQFTAKAVVGVAAADGKFLWRYDRPANGMAINCSTPIFHNGQVFAASAYNAGGGLVKLSKEADGVKAEEVYSTKNMQNHHGGMILLDGCLYGANGGNSGGYLACLDFETGKVLWDERDSGKNGVPKGSVALADNRFYYLTEKGTVLLIEPSPKKYIERGRFVHPDRSKSPDWTHPVIANGKLYLRDQGVLTCYDIKAK
jgi:outer membrane protein assembly factor BamB